MTRSAAERPFVFEPATGGWTLADRDLTNHEVGHAVAGVFFKFRLHEVRIDRPDAGVAGHAYVCFEPGRDIEDLYITIAGRVGERRYRAVRRLGHGLLTYASESAHFTSCVLV